MVLTKSYGGRNSRDLILFVILTRSKKNLIYLNASIRDVGVMAGHHHMANKELLKSILTTSIERR